MLGGAADPTGLGGARCAGVSAASPYPPFRAQDCWRRCCSPGALPRSGLLLRPFCRQLRIGRRAPLGARRALWRPWPNTPGDLAPQAGRLGDLPCPAEWLRRREAVRVSRRRGQERPGRKGASCRSEGWPAGGRGSPGPPESTVGKRVGAPSPGIPPPQCPAGSDHASPCSCAGQREDDGGRDGRAAAPERGLRVFVPSGGGQEVRRGAGGPE